MFKLIRNNLPNAATCLNLAGGFAAIIIGSQGDVELAGLLAYQWAFIFIGIAAVADFFDGFMARALGAYSDLGKELDSLCDLVSFGVAPGVILYNCILACGGPMWEAWFALCIPICAALRLARFNIDTRQTTSFIGLPVPANALFWIGYVSLHYDLTFISPWFTIPVILLVSWLMVSPVPMFSLKFKHYRFKGNVARYLLVAMTIIFVCTSGTVGLLWTIIYYVLTSLAFRNVKA